jgi:peptidoglycan/LPS O-acetylase OafA/YrhL
MLWTSIFVAYSVLTPCCLDTLGGGAALALLHHDQRRRDFRLRLLRWVLVMGVGLLAALIVWKFLKTGWEVGYLFVDTAYMLTFVWLVNRAADGFGGVVKAILEFKPVVYLGTISYGIYIYHYFVPTVTELIGQHLGLQMGSPQDKGVPGFLYMVAAVIPVASLSWHFFEKPINGLKDYWPYVPRPVMFPSTAKALDRGPNVTELQIQNES